jgi:hypothetical protein
MSGAFFMDECAGIYHYHRVGHDDRPLELRPDGTIGLGNAGAERGWRLKTLQGSPTLSIFGDQRGFASDQANTIATVHCFSHEDS